MGKHDARLEEMRRRASRSCGMLGEDRTSPPAEQEAVPEVDLGDPFDTSKPAIGDNRRQPLYMSDVPSSGESTQERKLRMLRPVKDACWACSMCELGQRYASRDDMMRDPHVFSNMNPSLFMLVGQNPGWDELGKGTPLVGQSGNNLDDALSANGVDRSVFYISNAVRCWTSGNERPTERHLSRCEPFLHIEVNLLRPKLVATLGAVAFSRFCPGVQFSDGLGTITKSDKFGVPVFALYHPSPRNLEDELRREAFSRHVRLLCGLVAKLS